MTSENISVHEQCRESRRDGAQSRRLLYPRAETATRLSMSIASVIRLENSGVLVKVKPSGKPNGKVFHTAANVHAVAGTEQEGA